MIPVKARVEYDPGWGDGMNWSWSCGDRFCSAHGEPCRTHAEAINAATEHVRVWHVQRDGERRADRDGAAERNNPLEAPETALSLAQAAGRARETPGPQDGSQRRADEETP